LRDEKDFRSLPMAIAAAVADDPAEVLAKKIEEVDLAIEYSKEWNQDAIQIGSAYFMKTQLLAREDLLASETCYLEALSAFRSAGMKAEIARTRIELAALESQLASKITSETEGSAEWNFGSRMLGVAKILFRLAPVETALAVVGAILLIGAVIGFFFLGGKWVSLD
jgi:hypothetical protein